MDIRSKKFSENMVLRVVVFLLCVIMFTGTIIGMLLTFQSLENSSYNDLDDLIGSRTYLRSTDLQYEMQDDLSSVMTLLQHYKNEDNIKNGNLIDDNELERMIEELFYSGEYSVNGETVVANSITSEVFSVVVAELGRDASDYDYDYLDDYGDPAVREAFKLANKDQIAQFRQMLIQQQLQEYKQLEKYLDKINGFSYYATDGKNTVTNLKIEEGELVKADSFKKNPAYAIYEKETLQQMPDVSKDSMDLRAASAGLAEYLNAIDDEEFTLYMAYSQDYIDAKQASYSKTKDDLSTLLPATGGMALLTLVLFIWMAVTTGQPGTDGTRKLYKLDRIWTELQLTAMALTVALGLGVSVDSYNMSTYYVSDRAIGITYMESNISITDWIAIGAVVFGGAAVGLWFVLSCIRLLKSGRFFKNAIIYKIVAVIVNAIMETYHGSSVMKKVVLVALGVCLVSATVFLAPVVFVAIIAFAPRWVKKYEEVKKGVCEVKNGNLNYKIPITGDSEFDNLARDINEISMASSKAIQNELKNQRMKTELISNVSHDLKTPLTSMVTYVDLLKKEGLDSPNAPEYLEVLDQKTNRLRQLTEDLFEAAKASSGAMPVRMERVEMISLINQGLGEMDERIEASGLEFILNAEKEKYYVMADGQLLWRVVENLLGNVLKYAQENTRVYIDVKEQGKGTNGEATMVVFEIKNISKQALNMDPTELMERFKRGDESRTTEGSGLGLAIAKDLVKLQNGFFDIIIDGDLFKAQVMLSRYTGKVEDQSFESIASEVILKQEESNTEETEQ